MHHGASPLTPEVREALALVMRKIYWPQDVITWCCVGWLSAEYEVTTAGHHVSPTLRLGTLV